MVRDLFLNITRSTPEGEILLKQQSKITHLLAVGLICLLFFSACAQNSSGSPGGNGSSAIPAGPIKIGVSLSLTGDDSADGKATQQGYDTWEAYVNSHGGILGHQVQMIYYDDGTKTDQTRANYEKLITVDHVNFVIGPFDDPQTITGAEVARQHHMFLLDIAGTGPEVFQNGLDNLFAVSLSATAYFTSFVHYILSLPANLRPKTAAYATSDDGFTEAQIDSARPLLENGGISTALYTKYSAENADPTGPAQKVVDSKADIVLLGTAGLQDCSAYIKTFIQQKFNPKLIIAAAGPDQGQDFINAIGKNNTEGLIVPNDGWWPESKAYQNSDFVQFIDSKYNMTPDGISSDSVQAFSAGQVLQQAIERAQSLDNTKIMNVLRQGTFQSLQGPVAFDSTGQNKLAVAYLFQWQKGQLIPVFPQDQAMANVEYPKPAWNA
jgi:branched-chain amino acid transport system substrate-binding protein